MTSLDFSFCVFLICRQYVNFKLLSVTGHHSTVNLKPFLFQLA